MINDPIIKFIVFLLSALQQGLPHGTTKILG